MEDTTSPQPLDHNAIKHTTGVQFHGKTGEFFSIWIVNLLLTIVTLGIYSAWAKVRTNRYFYSNTEIDGHRFSYLGDPIQILKGRIIGLILFGSYFLASAFSPLLALGIMIVLMLATPVLICLSVRFQMRMTAYRNVRFNFTGRYGEAFIMFFLLPILGMFTLGLAMPWAMKKMDGFLYSHITFGDKVVRSELKTSEYYVASIGAVVIAVVLIGLAAYAMGASMMAFTDPEKMAEFSFSQIIFMVAYVASIILASSFYAARIRNHIFNNSVIDEVASFHSELSFMQLLWLSLSNFVLLICTLGLAMPFVRIRNARLFAVVTKVNILQGADKVIVDSSQAASAIGDEVAEAFDIDIALG